MARLKMSAYQKELQQIREKLGNPLPESVIFFIEGNDEDSFVRVDGEKMSTDDFNAKYPSFKEAELSVEVGEWDDCDIVTLIDDVPLDDS